LDRLFAFLLRGHQNVGGLLVVSVGKHGSFPPVVTPAPRPGH
jgi:hypothetical protein